MRPDPSAVAGNGANGLNEANGTKRREPLSIEELLRKKKEQQEAESRPKFLTKAEREQLAIEERQKQVEAQKKRIQEERQKIQIPPSSQSKPSTGPPTGPSANRNDSRERVHYDDHRNGNGRNYETYDRRDRDRDRDRGRDYDRRDRYDRDGRGPRDGRDGRNGRREQPKPSKQLTVEEAEEKLIQQRYMGVKERKKPRKNSERKFLFDWNAEEDTSTDYNPLYAQKHDAQFFGRGHIAGFDPQHEKQSDFYRNIVDERSTSGYKDLAGDRMEVDRRRDKKSAFDNRHWSEKSLSEMKERDWRIFREDFQISSKGGKIPMPMRNWQEGNLPDEIMQVIRSLEYSEPTPIQRQAIPIGLQNRDLIGIAVTGSGKTAAFVIPMLVFIKALPRLNEQTITLGPYAIILAPTRELAQQIEEETQKFATPLGFKCVSVVGGHSIEEQAFNLKDGAEIIIATPGRLVDMLDRRMIVLAQCTYVVMDEADRMIELNFEASVNRILDALPVSNFKPDSDAAENANEMLKMLGERSRFRQTVMFSATMPPAVERLAKKYLRRPATVNIGISGEATETVEQRVEIIGDENQRRRRLQDVLNSGEFEPPIIVFANQGASCEAIAKDLVRAGWKAVAMHGKKNQAQRESSLAQLKNGTADVLVATDVAGRGIDVSDVSLVVNYQMPKSIEPYTHRIGRTGRAGKTGIALSFLDPSADAELFYDVKQMLDRSETSKCPPELKRHELAQRRLEPGHKRKRDEE